LKCDTQELVWAKLGPHGTTNQGRPTAEHLCDLCQIESDEIRSVHQVGAFEPFASRRIARRSDL